VIPDTLPDAGSSPGSLFEQHPLPEGWSAPAVVQDAFVADGLSVRRAGLSSMSPRGEEILGSAADVDEAPLARAYFELLERVTTIEWLARPSPSCNLLTFEGTPRATAAWNAVAPKSSDPSRFRYARSNGVALHDSWNSACRRAFWELCERDRVLRAWYGETVPERIEQVDWTPLTRTRSYEWRAYSFPPSRREDFSRGVHVAGVFGFPNEHSAPLVFGYGACDSAQNAFSAAAREATQLLAFLWGEPISATGPVLAPTPAYHLDLFQQGNGHDALRRWLDGEHARFGAALRATPAAVQGQVEFVDLTPPWLKGLRVAKAFCPVALPLVFGDDPMASHLPPTIRAHPIA
jgi:YcaO cyclodehydratase, ATP-ad Mg2+-binding